MGASCTLLREFLFARLVVTEGMLLSGTKGLLLLINTEMQNARLAGRAVGVKLKGFFPVRRGIVIRY
ncbi:hypothetical protein DXT91_07785 [Agrobacterium tumefaciens]|nr:hypothetical protein [Agrobacterium tumefaciens]